VLGKSQHDHFCGCIRCRIVSVDQNPGKAGQHSILKGLNVRFKLLPTWLGSGSHCILMRPMGVRTLELAGPLWPWDVPLKREEACLRSHKFKIED
jgi:hypothetical protein